MSEKQYEAAWHKLRAYLKKQADLFPDGSEPKVTVLQVIFTMDAFSPSSEERE
jgi:hypothetical protein